ncbi:MAG TPA: putative glycolipid-binding domain-containing protein [Lichenihabitans sp.]|jgi:hypothetical protein|nr:putative glycolipid-binding domain-containing protein [Lichenihabitans sp.]
MGRKSILWRDARGVGLERLVLDASKRAVVADAVVIAGRPEGFGCRYRVRCDPGWRFRSLVVEIVGGARLRLDRHDVDGWRHNGMPCPALDAAVEIDLQITPFTNMLPIRRLGLGIGGSAEIVTAYVAFPSLDVAADGQRYTRLGPTTYRYESLDSDFVRDIEVDEDGLVLQYPGLFERIR